MAYTCLHHFQMNMDVVRYLEVELRGLEIMSTDNQGSELLGDPKLPSLSPMEISAVRCGAIAG
jgi:hypothetical protein